MEMNVLEEKKIVEIWLTKAEKNDPVLRESLKDIFAKYKGSKYTVAVFESGEKDLYGETLALLSYNKRKAAEREVRRERETDNEKPSVLEKLRVSRSPSRSTPVSRQTGPKL